MLRIAARGTHTWRWQPVPLMSRRRCALALAFAPRGSPAYLVAGRRRCRCSAAARRPTPISPAFAPDEIDYNWHVRPILSENCFKCHGPDPASREAGLRLDCRRARRAGAARDTGQATRSCRAIRIAASSCAASARPNVDERMPPESTHKTLSAQADRDPRAVDRERRRVSAALGVHRARSARPCRRRHSRSTRANDIDRFVLARLEREGLEPSAPADKETLDQPRHADADGPAADARGGRRVRRRRRARRVRAARRPPARVARLRRAHGRLLARSRALQRDRRLSRRSSRPVAVAVARLGHRGVRAQQAVRRVRHVAARRRLAARTRRASRSSRPRSCASASARPRTVRSTPSTKPSTWSSAPTTRLGSRSWGSPSAARAATTTSTTRSSRPTTTRSARSSTATTSRARTRRDSAAFKAARRCRGRTTRRPPRCATRPPRSTRESRRLCCGADAAAAEAARAAAARLAADPPTRPRASARRSPTRSPRTTRSNPRGPRSSRTCRRRARRTFRPRR